MAIRFLQLLTLFADSEIRCDVHQWQQEALSDSSRCLEMTVLCDFMIFEASPLWLFLCSTRQHAAVCYRVSSQLLRRAAPLAASSESEYKPRTVTQPPPHQVDGGPALGVEGEVNR